MGVDQQKAFDTDFWFQSSLLAAAALAFHVVLRLRAKYADPVILPLVVALNGLGLAMIHRLDRVGEDTGNNQLRWTLVAMAVAIAVIWFLKDHRILRRFTYISLAVSAVLLILPLVPGISAGEILGASVWIKLGPMTFQPGEIAKITLAIFFAGYLSSNRDLILLAGRKIGPLQFPRFKDMGPMITAWLVSIGVLVFQRDLGSSILFFGLFLVMIYVATSRISWVIIGLALIAGRRLRGRPRLLARRACGSTAGSTPSPTRSTAGSSAAASRSSKACSAWPTAASWAPASARAAPTWSPSPTAT